MTQNPPAPVGQQVERWVLAASILGASMAFIDGTVVNVALPALQQALGARRPRSSGWWRVTRWSWRRFSSSAAPSATRWVGVESLLSGRDSSPAPRSHVPWPPTSSGSSWGVPCEGSWRAIFWLNLPLAALTLFITLKYVPETRDPGARRLDLPGASLVTLGLGGLVFGLLEAPRFGFGHPLILAALGFALLALPGTSGDYWSTFFPGITVLGLGMAVTVAPLTTTVMGAVEAERAGLASGINNTVSRTASLLSIAVFGIVAYQRFNQALGQRLNALGIPSEIQQLLANERKKLAAAEVPPSLPAGLRSAVRAAIEASFVDAFRLVMLLSAALALGGALCAWLLIDRPTRGDPPTQRQSGSPPRAAVRSSKWDPK